MLGLGKFISPKLGVGIIKAQLQKQLKKEVKSFDLRFVQSTNILEFIVEGKAFVFDSDALKTVIKQQSSSKLKKTQQLDVIILSVNDQDEINAKAYYTESDKKLFINFKI